MVVGKADGDGFDHEWHDLYRNAVLETDNLKLSERIKAARESLLMRLQVLGEEPETLEERQAITEALKKIAVLKQERLFS